MPAIFTFKSGTYVIVMEYLVVIILRNSSFHGGKEELFRYGSFTPHTHDDKNIFKSTSSIRFIISFNEKCLMLECKRLHILVSVYSPV